LIATRETKRQAERVNANKPQTANLTCGYLPWNHGQKDRVKTGEKQGEKDIFHNDSLLVFSYAP
jgi:hypothetical protein